MKRKIEIVFDDENVDTLGNVIQLDSVAVNGTQCMISNESFTEGVNAHTVFFEPYKMNIHLSKKPSDRTIPVFD